MILNKIEIINFRNYKHFIYQPKEGINIITGSNGIGKTNLVEAIYYLNLCKGLKTNTDIELIKENQNGFIITSTLRSNDTKNIISIDFDKNLNEKTVILNNKKITKLNDLSKVINILLFVPEFAGIFKDTPKERRKYLDLCVSKVSEVYYDNLRKYNSLLKERNAALKQEQVDERLIESLTTQMIKHSLYIVSFREKYIEKLNTVISNINNEISNKNKKLNIIYNSIAKNSAEATKTLKKLYAESLKKDIESKTTNIGIHKDDFRMLIDDKDISVFGSQGENRLASISLILASYAVLNDNVDKPILIFDDVLSELDEENQDRLIKLLSNYPQVFVTATETKYKEYEYKLQGENDL